MLEYDVMNYGALGNNHDDDHAAIQAAIEDAASDSLAMGRPYTRGGARVVFPPGTYRITAPLVLPGPVGGLTETGGGIHLIGHPGGVVIHGDDHQFPERRGLVEWTVGPPTVQPIADRAAEQQSYTEALFRLVSPGLPQVRTTPLDPLPQGLPSVPAAPPGALLASQPWQPSDFAGVVALLDALEAWFQTATDFLAQPGVGSALAVQRLAGLRFYLPQNRNSYALNRRWPLPVAPPDALVYLDGYLQQCVDEANAGNLVGVHPQPWKARAEALLAQLGGWVGSSCEASRLVLQLEDVMAVSNNAYHRVVFRFDGGVHRSRFRNITVRATTLTANGPAPPVTLSLYPLHTDADRWHTDYDTLAFLFEHRTPHGLANSDATGFQYGSIENVVVANAGGGFNCFLRGRVNTSRIASVFLNRALYGPGLHLISSIDADLQRIGSEGSMAHPEILLDGCVGLRFDGIGLGGASPAKKSVTAAWNAAAQAAGFTLSAGLVLRDTHDTVLHGRSLAEGQYVQGYADALQVYQDLAANPTQAAKLDLPAPGALTSSSVFPPALIRITGGCRRNRFSGIMVSIQGGFFKRINDAYNQAQPADRAGAVKKAFMDAVKAEIHVGSVLEDNYIEGVALVPIGLRTHATMTTLTGASEVFGVPFSLGYPSA